MVDHSVFENKTAAYYTLGCKLNFAETSAIGQALAGQGIRKAGDRERADICVINTCSVTELADKKCRQAIRRIGKRHPGAYIVVTGCYAQLKPEEVAEIEGVDLIVGTEHKLDFARYLVDIKKKQGRGEIVFSEAKKITSFAASCSSDDRTRHFLKVQDGCDYFCSYCTIPLARGRSRNPPVDSLVAQAEKVAAGGGKEIVLTGVNTGDFGKSTGETFSALIRALDEVEGIARYRISSVEPNLLTDEVIDFVARSRRFAPHFHLPLQSGSDAVLKLMKRKYDTALFRHRVETIQAAMPHAFIGVDVIVGTRGETEACFEEAFAFIESLEISQLHIFTYSERPGTKALEILHAVDPKTKQARSRRLLALSESKLHAFYTKHVGSQANVIFEYTKRGNKMHGFTANYIKVEAPYDSSLVNRPIRVTLGGWNEGETALNCKPDLL